MPQALAIPVTSTQWIGFMASTGVVRRTARWNASASGGNVWGGCPQPFNVRSNGTPNYINAAGERSYVGIAAGNVRDLVVLVARSVDAGRAGGPVLLPSARRPQACPEGRTHDASTASEFIVGDSCDGNNGQGPRLWQRDLLRSRTRYSSAVPWRLPGLGVKNSQDCRCKEPSGVAVSASAAYVTEPATYIERAGGAL
jgi:hypothetical protein